MDPILTALLNFGGMGLVSAVLLFLHHHAINAFRADQQEARTLQEKAWIRLVELSVSNHNAAVAKLDEYGKILVELNVRLKG